VPAQRHWLTLHCNWIHRVEWRVIVVNNTYQRDPSYPREDNWVWSPQGSIAMHLPEKWGFLQFSDEPVNTTTVQRPLDWAVRSVAMDLYYAEQAYKAQTGNFTTKFANLASLAPSGLLDGRCANVSASLVGDSFIGFALDDNFVAAIRNDRLLTVSARQ
jgi:hypothetical protein